MTHVEAETIECKYSQFTFSEYIPYVYTCDVQNREIFSNGLRVKIDDATGQHEDNLGNNQVKGIRILSAPNMNLMPSNIENVFPNLIVLYIYYSNLTQITSEDLKPFTKLEALYLTENFIEFIPEDLFTYNPKLEVIWLFGNEIQHIDTKAFSNLNKLRVLRLHNNACKSLTDADTRFNVLEMIEKIEQGVCQSDNYPTTTTTTTENPLIVEIKELKNQLQTKEHLIQIILQTIKQKDEEIKNLKEEQKC